MSVTGQVLAISGGGVRGLIPAQICVAIEKDVGAPIVKIFDVCAGTSTGSLVTTALLCPDGKNPKYRASDVVDLFKKYAPIIFHETYQQEAKSADGYYASKYTSEGMDQSLNAIAGDLMLSQLLGDPIFPIVTYTSDKENPKLCYIEKGPEWDLFCMNQILRGTTAAPTYFPAKEMDGKYYLDGGLMENNPVHTAVLKCANKLGCGSNQVVVSLGTGEEIVALTKATVQDAGVCGWLKPLINTLFLGQDDIAHSYTHRFIEGHGTYLRAQEDVTGHSSMDDASEENMDALIQVADDWIAKNDQELQAVCEKLKVRDDDVYSNSTLPVSPRGESDSSLGMFRFPLGLLRLLGAGYIWQPDQSEKENPS